MAITRLNNNSITSITALPSGVGGITEFDTWRLHTSFTGNVATITNWERDDTTYNFEKIGTGMSESSGVFSFPSTGKYLVTAVFSFFISAGEANEAIFHIDVTANNGTNYGQVAVAKFGMNNSYNPRNFTSLARQLVDVTDISNVKVKFRVQGSNVNVSANTSSNDNKFYINFMRVGDT